MINSGTAPPLLDVECGWNRREPKQAYTTCLGDQAEWSSKGSIILFNP